jgi:hypothetical protein
MQVQEKFTTETLTEGFLNGFVSGQITEAKNHFGIRSETDLQFEVKIMQLGATIHFNWIIGAHRVNPNPNPIMEDVEHITKEDYVPVVVGDTLTEISHCIFKILERVDSTQWKGILDDVCVRN